MELVLVQGFIWGLAGCLRLKLGSGGETQTGGSKDALSLAAVEALCVPKAPWELCLPLCVPKAPRGLCLTL